MANPVSLATSVCISIQGSTGLPATSVKTTLATTHSHAKVEPIILPSRPCRTSLVTVPDICPIPASHSGHWLSSDHYAKDRASKAKIAGFTCPQWCVGSVFSLNSALTRRLSSSKVFSNVANLGRYKSKFHHGLFHFSVSLYSTDHPSAKPNNQDQSSPRRAALVRQYGRLCFYEQSHISITSVLRGTS